MIRLLLAFFIVANAHAADITFHPSENVITVDGEIKFGDEKKFLHIALPMPAGSYITFRNNPGGNLHAGLEIGKIIRIKGFNTFAPNECYSVCALAWSAGIKRVMNSTSKVGFHAAYTLKQDGTPTPTAQGNAIVGAYLNSLGFSEIAIRFATYQDATGIELLNKELAERLGISVTVNDENTASGTMTKLSQAQINALKMVNAGKWGCDTDFKSYQKEIRCWDAPKETGELSKACLTNISNIEGVIGLVVQTKSDRRKFVVVREDPDRSVCQSSNGVTGKGVIVRVSN